jgi:hypothetical protein
LEISHHTQSHADRHPYADPLANSYSYAYARTRSDTAAHFHSHSHAHPDTYTTTDTYKYTDSPPDALANPQPIRLGITHTHASTYGNTGTISVYTFRDARPTPSNSGIAAIRGSDPAAET